MPLNKDGSFTLNDAPLFTKEQWELIRTLIQNGSIKKAQKLINDILKSNAESK